MMGFHWPWEASASITPSLSMLSVGMHLGWALTLGAGSVFLIRSATITTATTGRIVALVIALFCLLPNEWSPSWWLGLAFQTPSLTLQGLCGLYLFQHLRTQPGTTTPLSGSTTALLQARWPLGLLLVAIITGWVLALDTFAMFDIALYAIGFTPYAVLAALFFACLLQLISARSAHAQNTRHYRELAAIVLIATALHVLFRLPTGNLWDALLDPWLWIMAHGLAIDVVLRKTRSHKSETAN
jgi:hypothetical protein